MVPIVAYGGSLCTQVTPWTVPWFRGSVTGGQAAVDMHDLAGDVRRGFQEQDRGDHVADLADAPERGKLAAKMLVAVRRVRRCLNDARRDGVDPDAARGVLDGQRPGRRGQAALGQRGQ